MHPANQRWKSHKRKIAEPLGRAQRDFVTLGIVVAALLLFVGIGGRVMPQVVRSWIGVDQPPDFLLTNALLLNIALLIFGWRRYAEFASGSEYQARSRGKGPQTGRKRSAHRLQKPAQHNPSDRGNARHRRRTARGSRAVPD